MVSKGNHPQMALIQVSEILQTLQLTHIYIYIYVYVYVYVYRDTQGITTLKWA